MTSVSLTKAISIGPQIFTELTFRPIKFGDFNAIAKAMTLNDLDDTVALVARLANVDYDVAASIDPDDLVAVLTGLTEHVANQSPKQ